MNDTVVRESNGLTAFERVLASIGIRPDEKQVTLLLFGNMFMSGIAIGMIRVCAFTLFLEKFGSEQLALVAILLAIMGTLVTLIIDRLTHGLSLSGYLTTIIGTIVVGLATFRTLLGISDSNLLIFALPLFFEIVYMLFSLQFIALLTRLLNVRQSKRLSGITRSGEFLAEMVGGLSIAVLLNYMNVLDLLIVAILAAVSVFAIIQYTVHRFRSKLTFTTDDLSNDEHEHRLLSMLRLPYVKLISVCYAAFIFAYFFLEVAFYDYASARFPEQRALAEFLGQFFAATGLVTLFTMIFLFAPFLRRFGILAGVLAFPVVIAVGSMAVSVLEITGFDIGIVFIVMAVTNALRFVLQAAIWRPSVAILFQVLPDRQRSQGTSFIEGIVDPFSAGVAGIALYIITDYLAWEPKYFLLVLAAIMAAWISVGFIIRRMYLSNLVVSIRRRKLGELSLTDLDNASLNLIKQGLNSPYPAEIFYCLNILEELEHPEITELLKTVIDNHNHEVRMDVLTRIARMHITPLAGLVNERIEIESDPRVLGQALKTYAELGTAEVKQRIEPFLTAFHEDIRKGALVGLLSYNPDDQAAQDSLLQLVRSGDVEDRTFAATVMGEIGKGKFSGYLVELLDDNDPLVLNDAILAAGLIQDHRLINILVRKLSDGRLQGRAALALQMYGEHALYDLDLGFTAPDATRQVKRQIIDVIREIGGTKAIEILLRHINIDSAGLRHKIYLALATLHYQADPDDQYVFVNKLEEEVQFITWLLASIEDLYPNEHFGDLILALGQELDQHRDNMLLLISFLFPSIVMLDTRANIDSKVSELRVFALEILDNLLTTEIKEVVLPILDDLTVSERLQQLSERYPQQQMSPDARFNSLVAEHFDELTFWTRASLLWLIGKQGPQAHLDIVRRSLGNPEPIIRETAAWALAQLHPPDLRRMLVAQADDPDPFVSQVVHDLLDDLEARR
ncbi:MAG: Npt1/Npt2 family nucleotide transporter [Pseudomonadales bacterium]